MTPTWAVQYKSPDLEGELKRADVRLIVVTLYAAAWAVQYLGKPLFVTRIESHRAEVEGFYGAGAKPSVHEAHPCRGLDARTHGYFNDAQVGQLAAAVNSAFEYRPGGVGLQTALFETVDVMRRLGRVNPTTDMEHLHLQVPPVPEGESNKVRLWWAAGAA